MPENVRNRKRSIRRNISNETTDSEIFDASKHSDKIIQNDPPLDKASTKKVIRRTLTASFLACFFVGLLQTGHLYCILSGVIIQVT